MPGRNPFQNMKYAEDRKNKIKTESTYDELAQQQMANAKPYLENTTLVRKQIQNAENNLTKKKNRVGKAIPR